MRGARTTSNKHLRLRLLHVDDGTAHAADEDHAALCLALHEMAGDGGGKEVGAVDVDAEQLAHALDNDEEQESPVPPTKTEKGKGHDPFEVILQPEDDPKNLPSWRKWLVIFVISTGTLCATSASSMVRNFVRHP